VLGLTKEESRISLIGVAAALLGSLIGSVTGIWGTYAKFGADKETQIKADRYQAYTQLKGQQAEFLMLFQALALAEDKATLYQVRYAQMFLEDQNPLKSLGRKEAHDIGISLKEKYSSDAQQQERNSEHYLDELVACSGKMFESIGLTQLSFPPDAALSEKSQASSRCLET